MLSLPFRSGRRFCDGVNRRGFLQVGALGVAGLTLADLLRAQERGAASGKSVIMVNLAGGISNLDTYDMKPDAPPEIRGEFTPVETAVPGLAFCHLMPEQAKVADKMAILRGVRCHGQHGSHEFLTGYNYYPKQQNTFNERRPTVGAVASHKLGGRSGCPPYVSMRPANDGEDPAQLGPAHRPLFAYEGYMRTDPAQGLSLIDGLTIDRLQDRGGLLRAMDRTRRFVESQGEAEAYDRYQQRAREMIASNKVAEALDVAREPGHILDRWGHPEANSRDFYSGSLLASRRLVEAGVRVVTLHFPDWDTHKYNFRNLRGMLPRFDRAVAALITDIYERGLQDDVLLVMGGEMGRTPKVNDQAGRDHWPQTAVYIVAGGGLKMGQAIGSTDYRGGEPAGEMMTPKNVIATIYRHLGINTNDTFHDRLGRPFELLDDRRPVRSLI